MDESLIPELNLDEYNFLRFRHFFTMYDIQNAFDSELQERKYIGSKKPRICRFCHKTDEEVKFGNDAHVIPQFTGNRFLMSYFECNECNDLFSHYEDSFSKYIGISRTALQIPGKAATGVPTFKDFKTGLKFSLEEPGLKLVVKDGSEEVELDEENKKLIIRTIRQPYIPVHIPKALLKIAFCLLPEEELPNYDRLRRFLIKDEENPAVKNNEVFFIHGYFIPGPTYYRTPLAYLYVKGQDQKQVAAPDKQLIFMFGNYLFQIPLIGEPDQWMNNQQIAPEIPLHPLPIDDEYFQKYGPYQELGLNLTSSEKKKNDPHVLTFSTDAIIRLDGAETGHDTEPT